MPPPPPPPKPEHVGKPEDHTFQIDTLSRGFCPQGLLPETKDYLVGTVALWFLIWYAQHNIYFLLRKRYENLNTISNIYVESIVLVYWGSYATVFRIVFVPLKPMQTILPTVCYFFVLLQHNSASGLRQIL